MTNKPKLFYGVWNGTARTREHATCTECGAFGTNAVEFFAEVNAGEIFSVIICNWCLMDAVKETESK